MDTPSKYTRKTYGIGRCQPCGKVIYLSRRAARAFAKKWHQGEHMSAYRCPGNGQHWHIGHLADPVVDGSVPRQILYPGFGEAS